MLGSSLILSGGGGDAVGAGAEGLAGGVVLQVAGDVGLGLGGDEAVAAGLGLRGDREVQVVGAAGLSVVVLPVVAGVCLVGGPAGVGAAGGGVVAAGVVVAVAAGGGDGGGGVAELPVSVSSSGSQAVVARAVTAAAAGARRAERAERAARRERIEISSGCRLRCFLLTPMTPGPIRS